MPADLGPFVAVATGDSHTCAGRTDGRLVCFGSNQFGQCKVPADLGPVLAVATGEFHTCAVRTDGRLVCFGFNKFGRCNVPADLGPFVAVATGDSHTCAVRADGRLVCFGFNEHGQCDVPADLRPLRNANRWSASLLWTTTTTTATTTRRSMKCPTLHGSCQKKLPAVRPSQRSGWETNPKRLGSWPVREMLQAAECWQRSRIAPLVL